MSKKRILSNGHSSYWKDDVKVYKKENSFIVDTFNEITQKDNFVMYMGIEGMKEFNNIMKEHFEKEWKQ